MPSKVLGFPMKVSTVFNEQALVHLSVVKICPQTNSMCTVSCLSNMCLGQIGDVCLQGSAMFEQQQQQKELLVWPSLVNITRAQYLFTFSK